MKSILVIRRDNIGDLVCTTPLIHALRERFPEARIDALVNSYNVAVLAGNPDLDHIYAYTKGKHRAGDSIFAVTMRRIKLMWGLRRTRYDLVVLANGGCIARPLRLARQVAPRHILGFYDAKVAGARHIDMPVPLPTTRGHEVEMLFSLLQPLGIAPPAGRMTVCAAPAALAAATAQLARQSWYRPDKPTLAVHISARKPSQRWPAERFVSALREWVARNNGQCMLFWSPGDASNPLHPGDDAKAAEILAGLGGDFPILPWPTEQLGELMAGLAVCDGMLCSDGGAMHIGAGLGLPIVCFFGQSEVAHWHPWGVAHQVLQTRSREVAEIGVPQVLAALLEIAPAMQARREAAQR